MTLEANRIAVIEMGNCIVCFCFRFPGQPARGSGQGGGGSGGTGGGAGGSQYAEEEDDLYS